MKQITHIKAISFDLDDTFWHTRPIIQRAESKLHRWLEMHYPRLTQRFSIEDFMHQRMDLMRQQPGIAHDLTTLRIQTLQQAARLCDYSPSLANEAFEVFITARNEVVFFSDVLPALEQLAPHFTLGALTNGNADVERIGIGHLFDFSLSAIDVGAAKPHRSMFQAAIQAAGVAPHEMMHVGDDHHSDINGAREAGLMPVWVNRQNDTWEHDSEAPLTVTDLDQLVRHLLP